MQNQSQNFDCQTGILVDLSEAVEPPKKQLCCLPTPPKSDFLLPGIRQIRPMLPTSLHQNDCTTGILVDISNQTPAPSKNPVGFIEKVQTGHKTSDDANHSDLLNVSVELLDDDEVVQLNFSSVDGKEANCEKLKTKDYAPSKNPRPLSPLTAHQRAEIFEQANTVAVRIQLANAKQNQESEPGGTADVDAVIENSPFPVEFPVGDSNMVTSTPAEKVAPAVDEHFKNFDLEKSPNGVKSKSGPDANKQLKPTGMAAKGSILKPSTLFSKAHGMDQKPPDGNAKRLSIKPSGSKQLPAKQTGIAGTRSKSNSLSSTVASLAMSTASDSAVVLKRPSTVLPQPSQGLKQDVKQKAKADPVPKTSANPARSLVRRATEKTQVAEKVKPAARRPSVASVGSSGKLSNPAEKNVGQSGPAKGTNSSLKPPLHRNVMGACKEAGAARNGLVKTSKK